MIKQLYYVIYHKKDPKTSSLSRYSTRNFLTKDEAETAANNLQKQGYTAIAIEKFRLSAYYTDDE